MATITGDQQFVISPKVVNGIYAGLLGIMAYIYGQWSHSISGDLLIVGAILLGLLTYLNFGLASLFMVAGVWYTLWRVSMIAALAFMAVLFLVWAFGGGDRRLLSLALSSPIFVWLHLAFLPSLLAFGLLSTYAGVYVGVAVVLLSGLVAAFSGSSFLYYFIGPVHFTGISLGYPQLAIATLNSSHFLTLSPNFMPLWYWHFMFWTSGTTYPSSKALADLVQHHVTHVSLFRFIPAHKLPLIKSEIGTWHVWRGVVHRIGFRAALLAIVSPGIMRLYFQVNKGSFLRQRLISGIIALVTIGAVMVISRTGTWLAGLTVILSVLAFGVFLVGYEWQSGRIKELGWLLGRISRYSVNQLSIQVTPSVDSLPSPSLSQVLHESPAMVELDSIIGMAEVKDFVREIHSLARVQKLRRGTQVEASQTWHMIFSGNPGTGKTTIARIIGRILREQGFLTAGQFVEVTRADLVAGYIGQTALKTQEKVRQAIGGVLFIDEAYGLVRGSDSHDFGREAIDTLVQALEAHRENLVVILAGYPAEMETFLEANPGLRSRFPHHINFPDYLPGEIYEIAATMVRSRGFVLEADAKSAVISIIQRSQLKGQADSGNGRLARNLVDTAIRQQSKRLGQIPFGRISKGDLKTLTAEDFGHIDEVPAIDVVMDKLDVMVGLSEPKQQVRALHALLATHLMRQEAGLAVEPQNMHTVFMGNPGTGKTTVARLYAEMLYSMQYLKRGHLVEVDRSQLVAGYRGQTAIRVQEVFKQSLGGVLFIDEAYSLARGEEDSFGLEAVDTLIKLMEDFRNEVVVIIAGYQQPLEKFLVTNPGLSSRFANHIFFPDYSGDELVEIAQREYDRRGYSPTPKAINRLRVSLVQESNQANFGNARAVINRVEQSIREHALRTATISTPTVEQLSTITESDIVI